MRLTSDGRDILRKNISGLYEYIKYCFQYKSMVSSAITRNFKNKYLGTVLGYFWYILYPLIQILIYYTMFTLLFGRGIENYWIYASCGIFAFRPMRKIISNGCEVIVKNKHIVSKIVLAKEILVIINSTVEIIPLVISYVVLIVVMVAVGNVPSIFLMLVPVYLILGLIFATGISFIVSSLTVYIRDISNAVRIILALLFFATPLIYLTENRSSPLMEVIWSINPFYYIVECIHDCIYWGVVPDAFNTLMCFVIAPVSFIFGLIIFKKLEKGFVERL